MWTDGTFDKAFIILVGCLGIKILYSHHYLNCREILRGCGKSSNMCSLSLHCQSSKYLSAITYLCSVTPYFIGECSTFQRALGSSLQYLREI